MLEQTQERLHSIAQDMHILNRSRGEEIFVLGRAEETTPTDEVAHQRKRARVYKGAPRSSTTHIVINLPSTFTSPFPIPSSAPLTAQSFTNVAPFRGLFSTVFGLKQTKQASTMSSFVVCPRLPCWDSCRRSAESRTCHTRERLDGDGAVSHTQQNVDPKRVRTIQVGEFLRKYVSR